MGATNTHHTGANGARVRPHRCTWPGARSVLAAALVDTISDPSKNNALWNLGGPDAGLSMTAQGELIADVGCPPSPRRPISTRWLT